MCAWFGAPRRPRLAKNERETLGTRRQDNTCTKQPVSNNLCKQEGKCWMASSQPTGIEVVGFRTGGRKHAIVFIHGFFGDPRSSWQSFPAVLSRYRDFIRLGHRQSWLARIIVFFIGEGRC